MHNSNNKRIIKNTAMLYIRMLFSMGVSLYTSRVILSTLGVVDYGIYNVVGGVVIMFTFLSSAMGGSTSRFLTFELGKKDYSQLKKVFSTTLCIHIALAFVIFLLAETIGLWFLMNKLVIPAERMGAAHWVFQFSVLSCMISILRVPYNATIIAHEQMNVFAYISILDVILRLIIVYLLTLANYDKLKVYSLLVFAVAMITTSIYRIYCKRQYAECSFSFHREKALYKTLISYSSWDLFGNFAVMGMGQGLNMLLNIFFGPAVNAARAISYQVQGAIAGFANNFLMAVWPQIIKYYAKGNIEYMMKLVFSSSKYSFYLLYILSLPVILETHYILGLWLKIVPDYTARFCQLILVNNLIWVMRNPIVTSFHATGNIKLANVVAGGILLSIVPISYLFLKLGFSPESVFIVTIVVTIVTQIAELILLKRLILYSVIAYIKQVIVLCAFVAMVSAILPYLLTVVLEPSIGRFIIVGLTSVLTVATSVYFIGMDRATRQLVTRKVLTTIQKPIK